VQNPYIGLSCESPQTSYGFGVDLACEVGLALGAVDISIGCTIDNNCSVPEDVAELLMVGDIKIPLPPKMAVFIPLFVMRASQNAVTSQEEGL